MEECCHMEPNELEQEPFKPEITLEDFQKLDLRVCQVVACEEVVKSRNFLKLTVNDTNGSVSVNNVSYIIMRAKLRSALPQVFLLTFATKQWLKFK